MIRSKFILSILAAFCGLALQFHSSAANAQTCSPEFGQVGGIYNNNVTPGCVMSAGSPQICSPYVGNCLYMSSDGNLYLFSGVDGNVLWFSDTGEDPIGNFMGFFPNGDMQIATVCSCPSGLSVYFDTGTQQGGSEDWSGSPGQYLTVQDDGNLVIYDGYLNPLWAATYDSTYDGGEGSLVRNYCYSIGACN